jgi:hypothetical protein
MKNIIVYLNLILLTSLGYAQVDLNKFRKTKVDKRNFKEISNFKIYSKDGNISQYDSASFENEDSNIYVFTKSGNTLIFPQSNLDSLVSDKGKSLSFTKTNQTSQRNIKNDPMVRNNRKAIISIKSDLSDFSRLRSTGYLLQIVGSVVTIGGALNENPQLTALGGIISIAGFVTVWRSGEMINYNSGTKRKTRR